MTIQFRKGKNGDWAIFGPASEVKMGSNPVRKKDGSTTTFEVTSISAPFDPGGELKGSSYVYGYATPDIVDPDTGKSSLPKTLVCSCGKKFSYGDCKLSSGNWKEGWCGSCN